MSVDNNEGKTFNLSEEFFKEAIPNAIDYSFLNHGPYKFGPQESELNSIIAKIKSNTLSLKDEAKYIITLDNKTDTISLSLTETKTKMSVNLGKALLIHRQHFRKETNNSRKESWIKWVSENIPNFDKDRRWIHEKLGEWGETFSAYYFLGATELAKLIQICTDVVDSKSYNKTSLKYSFDRLGISFKQISTDREREHFKKNLEILESVLRAEAKLKKMDTFRDLVLDCIDSGVVFDNKAINKINEINSDPEIENYLKEIRISGSVPNDQTNRKDTRESLDSLFARLCDTIDIYIEEERLSTFDKELAQITLKNVNNILAFKEIKNV